MRRRARRPGPVGGLVARVVRLHGGRVRRAGVPAGLARAASRRAAAVPRARGAVAGRSRASPRISSSPLAHARRVRPRCPTGASTSPTCASSCSATVGDLTYDVARWTPGARGRRRLRRLGGSRSPSWCAATARSSSASARRSSPSTGTTAYGIALLELLRRPLAEPHPRPRRAAGAAHRGALARAAAARGPAVAPAARTGGLAPRPRGRRARRSRWPGRRRRSASRAPRSPQAAPGGSSLRGSLDRLWHPPPLDAARARRRARARRATCRARRTASLMVAPRPRHRDPASAAAASTGCSLGDPWETSFVADDELPALRAAASTPLRPGDRMLIDAAGPFCARHAARGPLARPADSSCSPRPRPAAAWALQRITGASDCGPSRPRGRRFTVVELRPGR